MNRKDKLFYIQPYLVSYRQELVNLLSEKFDLTVLSDVSAKDQGFSEIEAVNFKKIICNIKTFFGGRIFYQAGILKAIIKNRPDKILAAASVRDLSFWLMLILCAIKKIPVYSHGQGLYNKKHPNIFFRCMYQVLVAFTERYICYTDSVKLSLLTSGVSQKKLVVAENSINFKHDASSVNKTGVERGILFIGRLREGCKLDLLIESIQSLRDLGGDIILHIVGTGELEQVYKKAYNYNWINWYGKIYDEEKILEISQDCRIGCYPGNAGLSVVHYLALRLPPLIHSNQYKHMGPEPSYVINNENGFTFNGSSEDLEIVLNRIWFIDKQRFKKISDSSNMTYTRLISPSSSEKIYNVLKCEDL